MSEITLQFEQIVRDGVELSERLFRFSIELSKKIPKEAEGDERGATRRAVLRGFLLSGGQLAGQVVNAVSQGNLILAIVGLRSLLEFDINSNYIFDNPKHKDDNEWVYNLCQDIFNRTNDLGMLKSRLGGVSLKIRAKEIKRLDLYTENYASMCDYAHLCLMPPLLNRKGAYEIFAPIIISQALCNLAGVIDAVIVYNNFSWDQDLFDKIRNYRDKYE